jgi:hypothetical protein
MICAVSSLAASPPPAQTPPPAAAAGDTIARQLAGHGVQACGPLVERLENESSRPSASRRGEAVWKPTRPNELAVAGVVGETATAKAGGQTGVQIIVAAPSAKGECSGAAVHVTISEQPCTALIQNLTASGGKYAGPVVEGVYKVTMPNAQFILANGAKGTCLVTRFLARYPG